MKNESSARNARKELLLGSGNNAKNKRISFPGSPGPHFFNVTTLDIDPLCQPDVCHDLNECPWPFEDNTFDEIHAYEVLEHFGVQGDYEGFFNHFYEMWRILKPDGYLCGTVPMWDSEWAWGDPGHTRVINKQCLSFLCPEHYEQIGNKDSAASDYRALLRDMNFQPIGIEEGEHQFGFVLQAKK